MHLLAWVLVWVCCAAVALWSLVALPLSAIFGTQRRAWRLAVAFDQLGNTAAGGDEDETFSSRCWRNRHRPFYSALVVLIDWVFRRLRGEVDHCFNAWLAEEEKRKSHKRKPRPQDPTMGAT